MRGHLYLCNTARLKPSCPPLPLTLGTIFPFCPAFVAEMPNAEIYGLEMCARRYRQRGVMFYSFLFFLQKRVVYFLSGQLMGIQPHNTRQQACATWHVSCRPSSVGADNKKGEGRGKKIKIKIAHFSCGTLCLNSVDPFVHVKRQKK